MAEKELTYESAFPGRFLQAGHFNGKRVTLVIEKLYQEGLDAGKGKQTKLIARFVGKNLELVINKTNAYCLKMMFNTNKVSEWEGRQVTWFPTKCRFGKAMVDCIRVWGSPELTEEMALVVPQGRSGDWEHTLKPVKLGTSPATTPPPKAQEINPKMKEYWEVLGLSDKEGLSDRAEWPAMTDDDYIGSLNKRIEEKDAVPF